MARRLVADHPEIGAIVLECTNMPPFRADIQHATGLPVFDITTLVRMVRDAVRHGLPPRPADPDPRVTQPPTPSSSAEASSARRSRTTSSSAIPA